MISNIVKTITLAFLAMVILFGCDSNSKSSGEDTYFRLTPDTVNLPKTDTSVTLTIEGGTPPFNVAVYDDTLGSIATPFIDTYDRTVVYSSKAKEGVNTIEVEDKLHWTASAKIYQYQYTISINPSSLTMAATQTNQTFTVSGTSHNVSWRMTDSTLGSIKVLDDYGYIIEYTRTTKTGINILYAKDENDTEKSVTITQQ
ncbi:MAG: hypothetical protein PF692_09625 [Kiritimatiellae bacterium]|jgi:hypothetical protein|nr:hypothetical protein [Kiritimatiellia bacterium]